MERAQRARARAGERLGSGRRLNHGADDPVGMAMARSLEAIQRSLGQAHRNALDGLSAAQVAEEGVDELSELVMEMRELAVQAADEGLGDSARALVAAEYAELLGEYGRLTQTTQFNTKPLLGLQASPDALALQIGVDGDVSSRLSGRAPDVSLRSVGWVNPESGAAIVSSRPLEALSVPEVPAEARLSLGAGPWTVTDHVTMTGLSRGPFIVEGEASIDLAPGPYAISDTVTLTSSRSGPFTIPPPTAFSGRPSGGFDIVPGENDTLRLRINGEEAAPLELGEGFKTAQEVAQRINQTYPGLAREEGGAVVVQAAGEVEEVTVVGGSALETLGLSAGQTSEATNALVFRTGRGEARVTLPEGTLSAEEVVAAINAAQPEAAIVHEGRVRLQATGAQEQITLKAGSANAILGFGTGTVFVKDTLRWQVNYGGFREVALTPGLLSAEEVRDQINAVDPGRASVVGGAVRLSVDTGAAQLKIGKGTANGVFGVTSGLQATGDSLIGLRVGDTTRRATLPSGTLSMEAIAAAYNGLFPGVASVVDGRLELSVSGAGATLGTGDHSFNQLLGLPNATTLQATNLLRLGVDGGPMRDIPLPGGAISASEVADAINAALPGTAEVHGGAVEVVRAGSGASVRVGAAPGNVVFGLQAGQEVSTPTQGLDLELTLNGEPLAVHFEPGEYSPQAIVDTINATQPGFATLLGDGRLRLATVSVGTFNTVTVGGGSANAALGLSAGLSAAGIDTDSLALTHLGDVSAARDALAKTEAALDDLSARAAELGAFMVRVEQASDGLLDRMRVEADTLRRVEDADVALEAAELARAELAEVASEGLLEAVQRLDRGFLELIALIEG